MFEQFVRYRRDRARLRGTTYARGLDALASHLTERGHATGSILTYGRVAAHFCRWLAIRGVPLRAARDETVREFIRKHLPKCRCRLPGPRTLFTVRAALGHLLVALGREGRVLLSPPSAGPATIRRAIAQFDAHLRDTCGLAEATRIYRRRYVSEFLIGRFGDGPIDVGRITPTDLIRFLTRRAQRCRAGSAQVIAGSVKSFLRYQQLLGRCGPRLVAAIPRIPEYRLARLPMVLSEAQVARFLASSTPSKVSKHRDYAIARSLVDLGLRADEVAHIQLDDIDWRRSTIRLGNTKIRRAAVLPLPATVGRALAAYLKNERPQTSDRTVFVRHRAPVGRAIDTALVRRVARRTAALAGLSGPLARPHALRHTAATRMLRGGVSMKEVADVLRHSSIDTTAIYAKVDLPRLASVALPWPGSAP